MVPGDNWPPVCRNCIYCSNKNQALSALDSIQTRLVFEFMFLVPVIMTSYFSVITGGKKQKQKTFSVPLLLRLPVGWNTRSCATMLWGRKSIQACPGGRKWDQPQNRSWTWTIKHFPDGPLVPHSECKISLFALDNYDKWTQALTNGTTLKHLF